MIRSILGGCLFTLCTAAQVQAQRVVRPAPGGRVVRPAPQVVDRIAEEREVLLDLHQGQVAELDEQHQTRDDEIDAAQGAEQNENVARFFRRYAVVGWAAFADYQAETEETTRRFEQIQTREGEAQRVERAELLTEHQTEQEAQNRREVWLREHGIHPVEAVDALITPVLPRRRGTDLHARFYEFRFLGTGGDFERVNIDEPDALEPRLFDVCRTDRYFIQFTKNAFEQSPVDMDQMQDVADAMRDLAEAWWFSEEPQIGEVASVRRAAAPHIVRGIRASVATIFGEQVAEQAHIGRVCTFVGQGCGAEPEQFTPEDTTWHLERMGIDGQLPDGGRVHIALLDSGIDKGVVQGIEHDGAGLAPKALAGADRKHGSYMALLLRQLLPTQNMILHSYRIFDEDNVSDPSRLAAALDRAVFGEDLPDHEPLVVNLSLGWAPELGQVRDLKVTGRGPIGHVETHEDGIGSEVRAVLDRVDNQAATGRPVSVIAAAGNRPRNDLMTSTLQADLGAPAFYTDPCLGKEKLDYQWFFPAEWSWTQSCDFGPTGLAINKRGLVWAIGGTDVQKNPGYMSITTEGYEPHMVAPSELVVIDGDGWPDTDLELPVVLSGTSISAALASATAAYAQLLCTSGEVANCGQGLDRLGLGNAMYLAGEDRERVGRPQGVRGLNWCRLDAALASEDVMNCIYNLAPPNDPSALFGHLVDQCGELMDRAAQHCESDRIRSAPSWRSEYIDWAICNAEQADGPERPAEVCDESPCDFELIEVDGMTQATIDQSSVGQVGPQPGVSGCAGCLVLPKVDGSMSALVNINSSFPATTQFSGAKLILEHSDGYIESNIINPALVGSWKPGDKLWISGMHWVHEPLNWNKTKATVHMLINPPSGTTYSNESVIMLDEP